ncbi:MAG: T9SS type A sorting domain-containing protein [Muribaculum sp.]|nr:T9SS type A sorting domain-containing protein [Muribaculum sp.]
MRHLLFKSLMATMLMSGTCLFSDASPVLRQNQSTPWSRMRKATPAHQWSSPANDYGRMKRVAPDHTLPQSDTFQYLYGPDGTEWYATCNYDIETVELEGGFATQDLLKGYTYTIYNSQFKEIGTIHDEIKFEEGETRCAQVMLDVNITKKFFNYDDKYEVMVTMWMNNADYSMNVRTNVYSLGGKKTDGYDDTIEVISGYPADAVNLATQSWDEYFYITFLTEQPADPNKDYPNYVDFLADYKQILTTYTKATLASEGKASILFEHEIPLIKLPGDQMSCPMMFMKNVDGKLTLVYQQYEKSFFIDPSGMGGNEDITPDNNLVIDVYQLPDFYTKEPEHISTTKIATTPVDKEGTLYTFYGIGNLLYEGDIDFGNYTKDGKPSFIVSVDEYMISDDDNYNSSYYVYDADGNRIRTLAEDTYNFVLMSDVPGFEPQAAFIHTGDEWTFEFVDLYSAETVAYVDQMYRGMGLSAYIDRVPAKNGYLYAVATTNGIIEDNEDGKEDVYAPVLWLDMEGEPVRLDKIPVGDGVEMVRFYIAADALSPYLYNTDEEIEYMLLVKRRTEDGSSLQEEFLVATAEKGAIHSFLPDPEKGVINSVYLLPGKTPQLIIAYVNDYKYTSDSYSLPFSKFAGGTGTENDPYLVATAGDWMQICNAPSAHYKLTADIDCASVSLPSVDEFTGSIDGNGHTVSNIFIYSTGKTALFSDCTNATIKNINFFDCNLNLAGSGESAFIAGMSLGSTFENIHIRRLTVNGDSFIGSFAPISYRAWTGTKITGCEVSGAEINLPKANGIGGISGDLRTGAVIMASAFSGKITAESNVGGIAASTTTGDETITNCHVDADLKAGHTIGGIIAFLDRSKVTGCYVEGTIEATTPSKWTKALSVGGIAGELEGDWEGTANVPVTNNLIGISSIITPDMSDLTEDYPHQLATVHRVVGRTSYNAKIEKDEFTDPSKGDVVYETGVLNNLVLSDLAVIDTDFDEKTIEGTSISKDEVTVELLQSQLGFAYGSEVASPWNVQAWYAYDPSLWYESSICIPYSGIDVTEGDTFNIEIAILSRVPVSVDDILGDFLCEYDESFLEMTGGMDFDGKTMSIEFNAHKEGQAKFAVSMLGGTASCMVNISKKQESGVVSFPAETSSTLKYSNGYVTAEGCSISIYDINGRLLITGSGSIDTASLVSGIYVATATTTDGHTNSLKFVKI